MTIESIRSACLSIATTASFNRQLSHATVGIQPTPASVRTTNREPQRRPSQHLRPPRLDRQILIRTQPPLFGFLRVLLGWDRLGWRERNLFSNKKSGSTLSGTAGFLLVACCLAVAGCGDSAQSVDAAGTVAIEQSREAEKCREAFAGLSEALDNIESDLAVGVDMQTYGGLVRKANRAYSDAFADADLIGATCLEDVGVPIERAVNKHVAAYNAWNKCATDIDCDDGSIDTRRQRLWRQASRAYLTAAENLAGMGQ